MKWFLLLAAALVALVVIVVIIGACLPRAHVASRIAAYRQPPLALYAVVRDVAQGPAWRTGLKTVELLPPQEGRAVFRETSKFGVITFRVVEDIPGQKFVAEIADIDLPFGGTWIYEFAATPGGGGTLRITERGEVKNVFFRFMARFIFGYTTTMETYLRDLGRKFGEDVTPAP